MMMACDPMPLFVPSTDRNTGEVRPSSNATSTSSSIVSPRPPCSSGIDMPKRPIAFISSTTASGTASFSATLASRGTSLSLTKRATAESRPSRLSFVRGMGKALYLDAAIRAGVNLRSRAVTNAIEAPPPHGGCGRSSIMVAIRGSSVSVAPSAVSVGLIGLMLLACSGSTESAGSTGGGSVSAAQAATDVATALCARIEACGPLLIRIAYGDTATCTSRTSGLFADTLAASGTGWTPSVAETCAKAIPAASCDDTLGHNLPSVCHAPAGQGALGGTCGDNSQCMSSYCNLGPGGKCGTCAAALGAAGAVCYRDDDCTYGTRCVGQDLGATPAAAGKCVTPGTSGAPCSASAPCLQTLACINGVCGAPVGAAATCDQGGSIFGSCGDLSGNYCSAKTGGTCTKIGFAPSGQPCGLVSGVLTACSGGGVCNIPTATSGTCVAPAADFGNCNGKAGPGCLSPATCIGGTCVMAAPQACH